MFFNLKICFILYITRDSKGIVDEHEINLCLLWKIKSTSYKRNVFYNKNYIFFFLPDEFKLLFYLLALGELLLFFLLICMFCRRPNVADINDNIKTTFTLSPRNGFECKPNQVRIFYSYFYFVYSAVCVLSGN